MTIINTALSGSIAIFYNLFTHHFTSMMYKKHPYDEKQKKTIITLFVIGIIGIMVSKTILIDHGKFKNEVVQKGAFFGGIILVLTSLLSGWNDMGDQMKLGFLALVVCVLIYLSYKSKKDKKGDQEDILDELIKESQNQENRENKN